MRRVAVLSCALALACSVRPLDPNEDSADEDSAGEDSGTDVVSEESETTTDETTGEPSCDYVECTNACAETDDPCNRPQKGRCIDDVCVCEPPDGNCLPCGVEIPCLEWEACYEEYSIDGLCWQECHHVFQYVWDVEVGCVIQLHPQLPNEEVLDFFWYLEIEGIQQPRGDDCTIPESWVLDLEQKTLTLCPGACMLFQSVGALQTGWGIPCS
jgi:hypothetical protein